MYAVPLHGDLPVICLKAKIWNKRGAGGTGRQREVGAEKVFHSTHAFHNDKEIISLHLPQPASNHTETQWMLLPCIHCSVRPPRACSLQ